MKIKHLLILTTVTYSAASLALGQTVKPAVPVVNPGTSVTVEKMTETTTQLTEPAMTTEESNAIARGKVVAVDATGDILRVSSGDEATPDVYVGASNAAFMDIAGRPMIGEARKGVVGQTAKLTYKVTETKEASEPPMRELVKVEIVEPLPDTIVVQPATSGGTMNSIPATSTGSAAGAPAIPGSGPAVIGAEGASGIAPRNQPAHDPEKSATAISAATDGDITTSSDENAATDGDRTTVAEPSSTAK